MRSHACRPNFVSYHARAVRLGMPKSMPVTSFGVRNSFMRANRRQGPSSPRGLRSITYIGYPLKLQTKRSRKSALATADDQYVQDRRAVLRVWHRSTLEGDIPDMSARADPIRELGNVHSHAYATGLANGAIFDHSDPGGTFSDHRMSNPKILLTIESAPE